MTKISVADWFAAFGVETGALIFSNAQKKALEDMQHAWEQVEIYQPLALAAKTNREAAQLALILAGQGEEAQALAHQNIPTFPVKGEDVLALGIPAGPQVGKALTQVEEWWLQKNTLPERTACLVALNKVI